MEFNEYLKDCEESRKMKKEFELFINPRNSFNNIWKIYGRLLASGRAEEFRVAYGYMTIPALSSPFVAGDNVTTYANHAFFVREGKAVDPTKPSKDGRVYIPIILFERDEYINAVCHSKTNAALKGYRPYLDAKREFKKVYRKRNAVILDFH